jgi:hypothetical protein
VSEARRTQLWVWIVVGIAAAVVVAHAVRLIDLW